MAQTFSEIRLYGTAAVIFLTFEDGADATELYTGTDFAAGDFKISKDGAAMANTTNLPTQITAGQPGYILALTAAEMQASRILVTGRDASAAVWRGCTVIVMTRIDFSTLLIDANLVGGNSSAMYLRGVGTGNGITAKGGNTGGGADLSAGIFCEGGTGVAADGFRAQGVLSGQGIAGVGGLTGTGIGGAGGATSGAGIVAFAAAGNSIGFSCVGSGTEPGFKTIGGATGPGMLISGGGTSGNGVTVTTTGGNSSGILSTGIGTGQGLSLAHATDNALLTNLFDTLEGSEPSAAIASNATIKSIMQNLKRRFFNLVTQTTTVQTVYKDDSVTSLQTLACSNDGVTQSKGKAT